MSKQISIKHEQIFKTSHQFFQTKSEFQWTIFPTIKNILPPKINTDPLLAPLLVLHGPMPTPPRAHVAPPAILGPVTAHALPTLLHLLVGLRLAPVLALPRPPLIAVRVRARVIPFRLPARLQGRVFFGAPDTNILLDELGFLLRDVHAVAVVPLFTGVAGDHETGTVRGPTNAVGLPILLQEGVDFGLAFGQEELSGDFFALQTRGEWIFTREKREKLPKCRVFWTFLGRPNLTFWVRDLIDFVTIGVRYVYNST